MSTLADIEKKTNLNIICFNFYTSFSLAAIKNYFAAENNKDKNLMSTLYNETLKKISSEYNNVVLIFNKKTNNKFNEIFENKNCTNGCFVILIYEDHNTNTYAKCEHIKKFVESSPDRIKIFEALMRVLTKKYKAEVKYIQNFVDEKKNKETLNNNMRILKI